MKRQKTRWECELTGKKIIGVIKLLIYPLLRQPLWMTSLSRFSHGFEMTSVHATMSRATSYCFPLPLETKSQNAWARVARKITARFLIII